MLRQTLLAAIVLSATSAHSIALPAKPVTLDCQVDRKIILSGRVRERQNVTETVTIDLVGKRLTVGKKTGDYVVGKLNEAVMTGLPPRQKITFDMASGALTTMETSEFGEMVRGDGTCKARGR